MTADTLTLSVTVTECVTVAYWNTQNVSESNRMRQSRYGKNQTTAIYISRQHFISVSISFARSRNEMLIDTDTPGYKQIRQHFDIEWIWPILDLLFRDLIINIIALFRTSMIQHNWRVYCSLFRQCFNGDFVLFCFYPTTQLNFHPLKGFQFLQFGIKYVFYWFTHS